METDPEIPKVGDESAENTEVDANAAAEMAGFDGAFDPAPAGSEWEQPYIGPEEAEIYHSPERTVEIEPGVGPKPSWDAPPPIPPIQPPPTDDPLPPAQTGVNDTGEDPLPPAIPQLIPE